MGYISMNKDLKNRVSIKALLLAFIISFILIQISHSSEFPIEAKTTDGGFVTLFEDGTWRPKTLKLEHSIIRRGEFASKSVKGKYGFYEFWFDPKLWYQIDSTGAHEFSFAHINNEAGCVIIPERIQMTQDALRKAIISNIKEQDPNARMVQHSKAFVNGLSGEVVEQNATLDGIFVTYYTFLWSGSKGTIQVACWTGSNLTDEYLPIFTDFFGGFMLTE